MRMKKMMAMATMLAVLGTAGVSQAKISATHDDFEGSTSISSIFSRERKIPFATKVALFKDMDKDGVIYTMVYSKIDSQWWFFDGTAEMKIDDGQIIEFKNSHTSTNYQDTDFLQTTGSFYVPNEVIAQIATAKKIVVRLNFENRTSQTIELPAFVLDEWKQVIAQSK